MYLTSHITFSCPLAHKGRKYKYCTLYTCMYWYMYIHRSVTLSHFISVYIYRHSA